MYLLIIFLPLINALLCGLYGFLLGEKGIAVCSTFFMFITVLLSIVSFFSVGVDVVPSYFTLFSWVDSDMFQVNWGFMFDSLSTTMLVVINTISFFVHMYSVSYINGDPHQPRFFSYLSLFTFFIIILVTADNLIQMFVGWEGVGLCSYLLINFWFTRIQANKAAIKAMLINRVGDIGLALGILFIFFQYKAVDYATIFSLTPNISYIETSLFQVNLFTLSGLLLFIGAVGKSAQFGLHTWLPDAIEGPTPVSALIHAATIVTAGIFLILRCSPFFEYNSLALSIITVFGGLTAFFAAATGLLQNDLKRVIAYSTCSQLGYIMFACGLSSYSVSLFHLVNHAFFKALLFLAAGSVIHAMKDEQDMRKIGGLVKILPYTYAVMLLGSLALAGFPFISGFYSKDAILETAYIKFTVTGHFSFWMGSFAAFCTAFYSIRMLHLTFLSNPKGYKVSMVGVHEAPFFMGFPLGCLAILSVCHGYFTKDLYIGFGSFFWGNSLFTQFTNTGLVDAEFIPLYEKFIPLFFSCSGLFLAFLLFSWYSRVLFNFKRSSLGRTFYIFLNRKWLFDKLYNIFFVQKSLFFSYKQTYLIIDRGVFELFGPYGVFNVYYSNAIRVSQLQSGYLYHYLLIKFIIIILFLCYFLGINDDSFFLNLKYLFILSCSFFIFV